MIMSDLQISLFGIGILAVAAVIVFNRWQERKYRRHAEAHFKASHDDALLDAAEAGRSEPTLQPFGDEPVLEELVPPVPDDAAAMSGALPGPGDLPPEVDAKIDFQAAIDASQPIPAAQLVALLEGEDAAVRWYGFNPWSSTWERIGEGVGEASYTKVVGALQLASRAGPVGEPQLAAFAAKAQEIAAAFQGGATLSDLPQASREAAELDRFCAEVDVLIGLNLVNANRTSFPATKIRALAEAAGLQLEADGAFRLRDEGGNALFSLVNQDVPPFSAENIRQLATHGATFLLDVPAVANGLDVFDQMLAQARQMGASIGAVVVDDNRKPLNEASIGKIRQQLGDIYARMEAHGIGAGSARAHRLFS